MAEKTITLPSGAKVTLRNPADLRVKDRKKIYANAGKADEGIMQALSLTDGLISVLIKDWTLDLIIPSIRIESIDEMEMALWQYQKMKPDVMITHECPRSISKHVGDNKILEMFGYNPDRFTTKTSELLEMMFQSHQPKVHFFGHYHNNWGAEINGTQFRCLDELSYVELEV